MIKNKDLKIRPGYIFIECKYSYPPSSEELKKALKDWADLGFEYIELEGVTPEHIAESNDNKRYIKNLCQDLGLTISNFIVILPDIPSLFEEKRLQVFRLFDQAVEIADFFECETMDLDSFTPSLNFEGGIPYLEVFPPDTPCKVTIPDNYSWSNQWEIFVNVISKCNLKAKNAGIKLAIHPRTYEIINGTDSFLRLADAVNDDNLGVILDTAHFHVQKEILANSIYKLSGKIWHVHASDSDGHHMEHLSIGAGNIDWAEAIKALYRTGFKGQFVIDVGGSDLSEKYRKSKRRLEELCNREVF